MCMPCHHQPGIIRRTPDIREPPPNRRRIRGVRDRVASHHDDQFAPPRHAFDLLLVREMADDAFAQQVQHLGLRQDTVNRRVHRQVIGQDAAQSVNIPVQKRPS
jgi:hypothetical protein